MAHRWESLYGPTTSTSLNQTRARGKTSCLGGMFSFWCFLRPDITLSSHCVFSLCFLPHDFCYIWASFNSLSPETIFIFQLHPKRGKGDKKIIELIFFLCVAVGGDFHEGMGKCWFIQPCPHQEFVGCCINGSIQLNRQFKSIRNCWFIDITDWLFSIV